MGELSILNKFYTFFNSEALVNYINFNFIIKLDFY